MSQGEIPDDVLYPPNFLDSIKEHQKFIDRQKTIIEDNIRILAKPHIYNSEK